MIGRILRLDPNNPNKVGLFITSGGYTDEISYYGPGPSPYQYSVAKESLVSNGSSPKKGRPSG